MTHMAWAEIENYQQRRKEYEQGREQLVAEEAAYRKALEMASDPVALQKQYHDLVTKRAALEAKLAELKEIRSSAAQQRDEVGQAFSI
jgi:chromosome segregation ATPase